MANERLKVQIFEKDRVRSEYIVRDEGFYYG